jgi:hypothetical protein
VAGTGAVSEHHMTTTSQRDRCRRDIPDRSAWECRQQFFVFSRPTMQLRISLEFTEEPRSEATGLPDAGSRPRDVCSPMCLQWMQLDGFGGATALAQWVGCPINPIAGARWRPHRRSRGGPERQSQSARGGLLVSFFFPRGPGDPSIVGDGVVDAGREKASEGLRDMGWQRGRGRGMAVCIRQLATRVKEWKSIPGAVKAQWNGLDRAPSRGRSTAGRSQFEVRESLRVN